MNPKTLFDTPEERHAFLIGVCEVICPWPPYYKCLSLAKLDELISERHYYYFGRAIGLLLWIPLILAFKAVIL